MKKAGILFGITFFILGAVLSYIGYSMYKDAGATFKFLLFMPGIALWGLSLIIFPGAEISTQELKSKQREAKEVFTQAPLLHKIMWGIFLAGGLVIYAFRDNIIHFI